MNAATDNLMESFHEAFAGTYASPEKALLALRPLEDWENSLADWCLERGIEDDVLTWNFEPLMARLREIYDVVEMEGAIHVFTG